MAYEPPVNGKIGSSDLLTYAYPVGTVYMSTVNTSPASFLGGTWSAIQDRILFGAGNTYAVSATGGATTVTLTTTELPSHQHTFSQASNNTGGHTHLVGRDWDGTNGATRWSIHDTGSPGAGGNTTTAANGGHLHNFAGTSGGNGTGNSLSILNPYYAVYMWRRTA